MTAQAITNAIATAKKALDKYGAKVAWTQYVAGALPDASKPEEPGPRVARSYTPSILFTRDKRVNFEFLKFIGKTEVIGGDQNFILAGDCGFTPDKEDTFVFGGRSYSISSLDPLRPDGRAVLWFGKAKT